MSYTENQKKMCQYTLLNLCEFIKPIYATVLLVATGETNSLKFYISIFVSLSKYPW